MLLGGAEAMSKTGRRQRVRELDLICLSHLRWNFVFQRPQHLMTRCARDRRVFFVEEPCYSDGITPRLQIEPSDSITVVVPQLPNGCSDAEYVAQQRRLMAELMCGARIRDY